MIPGNNFCVRSPIDNSIIRKAMWKQKLPKNIAKNSNDGRLVRRTLFVVSEVLHFHKNNPQRDSLDLTVMLLICARELPSPICNKGDACLCEKCNRYFNMS
jgi:glycerol-3-phosphate O-acyltransferase